MRLKSLIPLAGVALCLLVPTSALAVAHPSPSGSHSITISVSENPIPEGQPLVIYGRLSGPASGAREVVLYHRGPYASGFTPVQRTVTDASGFYAFTRLAERVLTNRDWFVRSLGARSATVREHVYAQLTLAGAATAGSMLLTGPHHPVSFTGTVTPANVGGVILLQRQDATSGGQWHTIQLGRVAAGGMYAITHEFRYPGDANIRVLLRADGINIASPSNVLVYEVEQAENPALTIASSQNPITPGEPETISGAVAGADDAAVTLYARTAGATLVPVETATTDAQGDYSFPPLAPQMSTYYQVRSGASVSALLFVGVKYVVSASLGQSSITQGQSVTLTGSVSPASPDHEVGLQELAASGRWVTIQRGLTAADSTFVLERPLFTTGTVMLRAFVPGGPSNQGSASSVLSVIVTPASAGQLPPNPASDEPATGIAG